MEKCLPSCLLIKSKDLWELFFAGYSPGALFQSWLWGEVQKQLGISIWRFGIYEGKKLIGLAQITKVAARRGPFLHIRHGPILAKPSETLWRWLVGEIRAMARREGAWFIRLNPLIENSDKNQTLFRSLGFVPAAIHAMDAEYCLMLDLKKTEDELILEMRKSTRYEIRRAQKMGVEVVCSSEQRAVEAFLELYQSTSQRQEFIPHPGIREEVEIFGKEDCATVFLGSYQGKIIAAAVILFVGNQAIYHHGASIHSSVPASSLVQWEAIREAKKRGMKLYNFWGIAPDNKPRHPWRGITLFKTGFGGRHCEYIHAHDLPISPLYVIPKCIETLRRWRKGY